MNISVNSVLAKITCKFMMMAWLPVMDEFIKLSKLI